MNTYPAPEHDSSRPRRPARVAFKPGSENAQRLDQVITGLEELELRARALEAERVTLLATAHTIAASEAKVVGERGAVEGSMAYRSVQADVAAALHTGNTTAGNQLRHAHLIVSAYPQVHSALAEGALSGAHARVIADAGRVIGAEYVADSPEDAARRAQYETRVVEKAIETTPNALAPYAKRVAEQFATVSLDERYERAREHRMVTVTPLDDGMARLSAILPAHQALGAMARLRALAKQLQTIEEKAHLDAKELARAQGVEAPADARRSRSQIQADLVADLLLSANSETAPPELGTTGTPVVRGVVQIITHHEHLAGSLDDVLDVSTGATSSGVPTPELATYGPMPIGVAREIAGDTPTWIDVTTDPTTGAVAAVEPRFPSLAQRRLLVARDETCRWFGCMMPAHHCDVDHTIEYSAGGPTTITNMGHLCRNHHLLKHHGGWNLTQHDDGHYAITSPSGRTYRTAPASRVRFVIDDDPADEPPPGSRPGPAAEVRHHDPGGAPNADTPNTDEPAPVESSPSELDTDEFDPGQPVPHEPETGETAAGDAVEHDDAWHPF